MAKLYSILFHFILHKIGSRFLPNTVLLDLWRVTKMAALVGRATKEVLLKAHSSLCGQQVCCIERLIHCSFSSANAVLVMTFYYWQLFNKIEFK